MPGLAALANLLMFAGFVQFLHVVTFFIDSFSLDFSTNQMTTRGHMIKLAFLIGRLSSLFCFRGMWHEAHGAFFMVEDSSSWAPTLPRIMLCVFLHPPPFKTLHVTSSCSWPTSWRPWQKGHGLNWSLGLKRGHKPDKGDKQDSDHSYKGTKPGSTKSRAVLTVFNTIVNAQVHTRLAAHLTTMHVFEELGRVVASIGSAW